MKKNPIFSVILLISIYCFGISASFATTVNSNTKGDTSEPKKFSSTYSHNAYLFATQSEDLVPEIPNSSDYSSKFQNQWFASISESHQEIINAIYKQYKNQHQNQLIRTRKADLIYPFHNFW